MGGNIAKRKDIPNNFLFHMENEAIHSGAKVYVGSEFPSDLSVKMWIDLEGEDVPDSLDVPAYCEYEAVRVAGVINEKLSELKRGGHRYITFGVVTDNHVANKHQWIDKDGKLQEITALQDVLTKAGIRHGAYALKYVSDLVGCDFIANLGDNQWENNIDTENAYTAGTYTRDTLLPAFDVEDGGCFGFHLVGNHDQTDNNIDGQWELIGKHNSFDVTGATPERCYGYKDFSDKRVRVICLNTSDYLNGTGGYGISYEQRAFLMAALDLSEKEDCAEWKILLLSHIPLDFNSAEYNITADIIGILNAYVLGETVSITVNDAWASIHDDTTSGTLTYDYAGKNAAQIIGNIHGHLHNDCYGKLSGTPLTRISTPNTCFYLANDIAYENNGDYEAALIPKVQGTAKDTIATFYVADMTEQKIYSYAYGAGNDRVIDYTPQEVTEPEEPIVPEEPEEPIEPSYTNLFNKDSVQTNKRFSSSGGISEGNHWVMDEYIDISDCEDKTVRVYCPNDLWSTHPQRVICGYSADKNMIFDKYAKNSDGTIPDGVAISADGHLYTTVVPDDVVYIRVSGVPGVDYGNVIITVGEEFTV